MYSIGDLSRRTGVKAPTIRYYEQMGLLEAPERSEGNQRRFAKAELERLAFIRHARDLGLTINSIRQLSGHADRPCADADRIAKEQLASVRDRIAKLQKLEGELERIATCCTGETIGDCYVIRALSDHSLCGHEH
ncbi:helix-turn-helix domain-containing protein [Mesorhizobium sp.]|uniref:MerR family transcriptional regulator n=1 Tax=Mesorhizobium sp. TaxID=1871066 RepID=UPI000FE61920|nr:helix-turn-helix domain-containing protein [Mesorhizobium sp.]RWK53734.1 MAG: MerR family transcriptional regulator [Mesorhizobium sp.]TIP44227.1 MAG: MerR family transcriptional regulator [Mesorhizobium sp.]